MTNANAEKTKSCTKGKIKMNARPQPAIAMITLKTAVLHRLESSYETTDEPINSRSMTTASFKLR